MKLTEILNSINTGKEPIINDTNEKAYVPFVVSRCLSNFPDTLFYANELNSKNVTDRKMHYDYLFHSVRKRKRFSPWLKREESAEIDAVIWFFGMSRTKAEEALKVLRATAPDQIPKLLEEYKNANP